MTKEELLSLNKKELKKEFNKLESTKNETYESFDEKCLDCIKYARCKIYIEHKECIECFACESCKQCCYCLSCKDCLYCKLCAGCNSCIECTECDSCESCIECKECNSCIECIDCTLCEHCFLCADIKDSKYMILNIQLTEEECFEKMESLNKE